MTTVTERSDLAHSSVVPTGRFLRNAWYPILWSGDLDPGCTRRPDRSERADPVLSHGCGRARGHRRSLSASLRSAAPRQAGRKRSHSMRLSRGSNSTQPAHVFVIRTVANASRRTRGFVTTRSLRSIASFGSGWDRPHPHAIAFPISRFSTTRRRGHYQKFDSIKMNANYELIMDNLMDLSHTAFLHDGLLGNEATTQSENRHHAGGDHRHRFARAYKHARGEDLRLDVSAGWSPQWIRGIRFAGTLPHRVSLTAPWSKPVASARTQRVSLPYIC